MEICSRSIGQYVFPELISPFNPQYFQNDNNMHTDVDNELMITRKNYEFKEVMERFVLTGAPKIIEIRGGKHDEICWSMRQWYCFMDLIRIREEQCNEMCMVACIKKLIALLKIATAFYSYD